MGGLASETAWQAELLPSAEAGRTVEYVTTAASVKKAP
jgi:hypothetical protein